MVLAWRTWSWSWPWSWRTKRPCHGPRPRPLPGSFLSPRPIATRGSSHHACSAAPARPESGASAAPARPAAQLHHAERPPEPKVCHIQKLKLPWPWPWPWLYGQCPRLKLGLMPNGNAIFSYEFHVVTTSDGSWTWVRTRFACRAHPRSDQEARVLAHGRPAARGSLGAEAPPSAAIGNARRPALTEDCKLLWIWVSLKACFGRSVLHCDDKTPVLILETHQLPS